VIRRAGPRTRSTDLRCRCHPEKGRYRHRDSRDEVLDKGRPPVGHPIRGRLSPNRKPTPGAPTVMPGW
jgi:hypothetical protein